MSLTALSPLAVTRKKRLASNIRRVEPRAELFQLPEDYRTARMLDTLWLNPDVPEIWPAGASPAERCAKPWP